SRRLARPLDGARDGAHEVARRLGVVTDEIPTHDVTAGGELPEEVKVREQRANAAPLERAVPKDVVEDGDIDLLLPQRLLTVHRRHDHESHLAGVLARQAVPEEVLLGHELAVSPQRVDRDLLAE